jgi:hypothetical protein
MCLSFRRKIPARLSGSGDPCGNVFKPKRSDARYCSAACRQRAYVKRDGKPSNAGPLSRAEIERRVGDVLASNSDNAFTAVDLCDHVYPGLERPERKHRDAVAAAAKKVCERLEHWDWWRANDWGMRGAPLVFLNRASVTSYAMAYLKSDFCHGHRSEAEMKAMLAPGGSHHELVVDGGAWWRHTQEWLTDRQNGCGADLTSRNDVSPDVEGSA